MNGHDPLTSRLHSWARNSEPGDDRIAQLQRRIATRLRATAADCEPAVAPVATRLWPVKLAYAAAGAAVAALVIGLALRPYGEAVDATANGGATGLAAVSADDLAAITSLYSETERLFDDHLRWIADNGRNVSFGISPATREARATARPLLVRLVVATRADGETAWTPVWNMDTLVRGEDYVEVVTEGESLERLSLWTYPLDDGTIVVEGQLALEKPLRMTATINAVVPAGSPSEVFSLRTADREYRALQTVTFIDEDNAIQG